MMEVLFTVKGIVKQGKSQGKALGYPTANISFSESIPEGIYASRVYLEGKTYNAVSFVGVARTFDRTDSNLESYIFDFSQDIYEKEIAVQLLWFLRPNQKFETVEDLIDQMKKDVINAKTFLAG